MKLRYRILILLIPLFVTSFYFVYDFVVNEIRPRYLEAVEESLNDTANILATLVENDLQNKKLEAGVLDNLFRKVAEKTIDAQIYIYHKKKVNLWVYVTDDTGLVVYDSKNRYLGQDFSKWNDVYLTLRGKYGARSSLQDPVNEESSAWFVAAPVKYDGKILGSLTVVKPKESIDEFIEYATTRTSIVLVLVFIAMLALSFFAAHYLTSPFVQLTGYVRRLKENPDEKVPPLSGNEARTLGAAFQGLVNELEGKKYIEKYIQTLTHEIKSPLTSISGAAEILSGKIDPAKREHFIRNIQLETARLHDIAERLLRLAELENRSDLPRLEKVRAGELGSEIKESLGQRLSAKSIDLKIEDNEVSLMLEPFLFRQALFNLISNSIDFANKGGFILCSFQKTARRAKITIIDNGTPIPGYALNRIFERFYSLPRPGGTVKSTGLGLPFVKEVITLHHGEITINNNAMGGVTVEIIL